MPTPVALDPRLTATTAEPAAPKANCLVDGRATPCLNDVYDHLDELRAWGRGLVNQVKEIAGLQPR